jgi:hypothetical protein
MRNATTLMLLLAGCSNGTGANQGGGSPLLLPSSYYLVADSDGTAPDSGTDVVLLFEPSGIADLYMPNDTSAVGYRGTYHYDGITLHLKFKDPAFHPDLSFPFDSTADMPTMPFGALSMGADSSTWQRHLEPFDHNAFMVYSMSLWADGKDADTAIDDTLTYLNALAQDAPTLATSSLQPESTPQQPNPVVIKSVERIDHGLLVHVARADFPEYPLRLLLYGWVAPKPGDSLALQPGPFHDDLRLTLPTNSPGASNQKGDPTEKSALLIMPLYSHRMGTYLVPDATGGKLVVGQVPTNETGLDDAVMVDDVVQRLTEHGYNVQQLRDGNAGLLNMIKELLPNADEKRTKSPSLILYSTHGATDGTTGTGDFLVPRPSPLGSPGLFNPFDQAIAQHQATLPPDLVNFEKGAAIDYTGMFETPKGTSGIYYVSIGPAFWRWLQTQGANFSESLFFMAACDTDQEPQLREAIQAKAYFDYDATIHPSLAAQTFRYLVEFLSNHGRTAEEFFYNTLRVINTRMKEYCEDDVLEGLYITTAAAGRPLSAQLDSFQGYGSNGSIMVSYRDVGWLAPKDASLGDVWWLLFAGRWSQSAAQGWTIMQNCWTTYWAGMKSDTNDADCHPMNPGSDPTDKEVDMASYLLTGNLIVDTSQPRQPRWTLNDEDSLLKLGCCPPGPKTAMGICSQ